VHYASDVVLHAGATWQALRDTGQAPPHGDWLCLAAAGRDARSPVVRGTYDATASYAALNIIACEGAAFIARHDNPGHCPGEGWQMISRQGARGGTGERGPQGPAGAKGEDGRPGAKPVSIRSWKVDRARFVAVPLMSDGTEGPVLEMRSLFEQFADETR
jgi:hypothetical protein